MNNRILRAQLWELWRLTWGEFLFRVLMPLVSAWLLSYMPPGTMVFNQGVIFGVALLSALGSGLWLNSFRQRSGSGFPMAIGFPRPISAPVLVLVPLCWLVVTNCLVYLAEILVLRNVFQIVLPGLAFVPVVAAGSLVVAMLSWATNQVAERGLAAAGFCAVAWIWLQPRMAALDPLALEAVPLNELFRPTWPELVGIALIGAACIWATVFFIRQQRAGAADESQRAQRFRSVLDRPVLGSKRAFRSREAAQVWLEYRRTYRRALVVVATGLAFMMCSALLMSSEGSGGIAVLFWSTTLCLTPLVLLFCTVESVLGVRYRGQVARLSLFDATQPIEIGEAIRMKLDIVLRVTLAGTVLLVLGAIGCIVGILGQEQYVGGLLADIADANGVLVAVWITGGLFVLPLLVAAAALLIMSLGYGGEYLREQQQPAALFLGLLSAPVVTYTLERFTGWNLQVLSALCLCLVGVVLAGGTVVCLRRAAHAGLCSGAKIAVVAVGWTVLFVLFIGLASATGVNFPRVSFPWLVCGAGVLCIPVASVALAPLSMASARNQ